MGKRKIGRPKLLTTRSAAILVKLTPAEKAKIRELAERAGLPVTPYMRDKALQSADDNR